VLLRRLGDGGGICFGLRGYVRDGPEGCKWRFNEEREGGWTLSAASSLSWVFEDKRLLRLGGDCAVIV
jgi:hypothetical protein